MYTVCYVSIDVKHLFLESVSMDRVIIVVILESVYAMLDGVGICVIVRVDANRAVEMEEVASAMEPAVVPLNGKEQPQIVVVKPPLPYIQFPVLCATVLVGMGLSTAPLGNVFVSPVGRDLCVIVQRVPVPVWVDVKMEELASVGNATVPQIGRDLLIVAAALLWFLGVIPWAKQRMALIVLRGYVIVNRVGLGRPVTVESVPMIVPIIGGIVHVEELVPVRLIIKDPRIVHASLPTYININGGFSLHKCNQLYR
jgi:hypothetical protein